MDSETRRLRQRQDPPVISQRDKKATALTNAERCKAYRMRMKEDELKYEQVRAADRERCKANRTKKKMTEEELAQTRALAAARAKKYRAKKKAEQASVSLPKRNLPKTRQAKDEQRKNWREQKAKQRSEWSGQKKRWHRQKSLAYYYSKKVIDAEPKTPASKRKGPTKEKPATASPTIRVKLTDRIDHLKKKRSKESIAQKKLFQSILKDNVSPVKKNLYKNKPTKHVIALQDFLNEQAVPIPDKQACTSIPKKILPKNLERMHKDFTDKYPHHKISVRTLYRHKPKHIVTHTHATFRQCLCEICTNVDLKLEALKKICSGCDCGKDVLSERSVCKDVSLECLNRMCERCGVQQAMASLGILNNEINCNVKWKSWDMVEKDTGKRRELVVKEGIVGELAGALADDLKILPRHLHTFRWQFSQFKALQCKLPRDMALAIFDFAENFLCSYQDEVQSAHWAYRQVTVHPCCLYYACPFCEEQVTDYLVVLSDDLNHDAHFVRKASNIVQDHLHNANKSLTKLVIFSDGCSAQYKSRMPFFFLAKDKGPLEVERSYFGSRHGKSPCDSCGGTVKRLAAHDVANGLVIIQNATAMYDHMTIHHALPKGGCFAFKGKSKRVNEENFYPVTGDKFVKGRLKIYRQLWEELNIQIEILRSDLNCQIFDSLIDFVSGCHDNRGLNANKGMPAGFTGEIPTAVIVMGVNTPDHGVMFSNLDSMLRSKVTPLVARLKNKDCERINTVINCIVSQFMNLSLHDEDDDDEACFLGLGEKSIDRSSNPVKLQAAPRRRKAVSMTTLVKWYRKNYHRDSVLNELSLEKKTKISTELPKLDCDAQRKHQDANGSHKKKPLLIIMLEDVENINPRVLQDFISLCSSYLSSLPIVLVMGVATAVTAIHQLLPTAVSSLLCMEKYQAPPASQYLAQLMDKVVMTPNLPFKLGPNVFHFLLDIFLYHDFSILNFTMGYQSCMLEHFLNNPMSCLCCDEEDIDNVISQLTRAHLEQIRQHRSFKSFVMGLPSEIQESVATEDIATKKQLAVGLRALHSFHKRLFPALRFLHILSLELPKFPLGKQFREIYSICLTEELSQSEGYIQAFTYLQLMSLDDLTKLLSQAVSTLKDTKETVPEIGTLSKEVEGFIYRLKHIDEEKEEEDFDNEDGASMHRILPQRAKLHELKATLQSFSSRRRRSPYENLREEILDCLKSHFKQLIKHPLSLPLYDVLYFDDLSLIKNQIKPAPRHSTQMALVDPGRYLNCVCCECDIDDILPTMPDICIAYKLHLECGTLINLYDWLQAFITVVTSHEKGGRKKSDAKQNDELRARFIRAVSEMQFLGFIKSSKRKTDHVTRLTW